MIISVIRVHIFSFPTFTPNNIQAIINHGIITLPLKYLSYGIWIYTMLDTK